MNLAGQESRRATWLTNFSWTTSTYQKVLTVYHILVLRYQFRVLLLQKQQFRTFYEKNVETVMVNDSTNINKTSNHLSSQLTEHKIKPNDISLQKSRSWIGAHIWWVKPVNGIPTLPSCLYWLLFSYWAFLEKEFETCTQELHGRMVISYPFF